MIYYNAFENKDGNLVICFQYFDIGYKSEVITKDGVVYFGRESSSYGKSIWNAEKTATIDEDRQYIQDQPNDVKWVYDSWKSHPELFIGG